MSKNSPTDSNMKKLKTSGYAPVNGLHMYYEIHGNGSMPLVLIHGAGSTIEANFSKVLSRLSSYRKVIAVELQAHGRTSDREVRIRIQLLVQHNFLLQPYPRTLYQTLDLADRTANSLIDDKRYLFLI